MNNIAGQYLKYANVQMASEAFLIDPEDNIQRFSGNLLKGALTRGNDHSSRFTPNLATEFAVTNKGIKDTGWAFGQIADVWGWVDQQDQVLGRRRGRDAQGLQPRRASCLRSGSGFGQCGSSLLVTFCAKCFTFTST